MEKSRETGIGVEVHVSSLRARALALDPSRRLAAGQRSCRIGLLHEL